MSAGDVRERAVGAPAIAAGPNLSLAAAPRALHAVIVDASRGERRLDSRQSQPASLTRIDGQGRVLDWLLHALRMSDASMMTFIGGYHIQKVIAQYPALQFRFLASWMEHGEVEALRIVAGAPGTGGPGVDLVIARATALCVPEAIERLRDDEAAISLGLYQASHGRVAWAGLVHVPAAWARDVFAVADAVAEANPSSNLTDLIAALDARGLPMRRVCVDALAAPVDDAAAVSAIAFQGKARTLEQVAPLVTTAVVPESMRFSAVQWMEDGASIVRAVAARFSRDVVAVRSSAACEDGMASSLAGRFRSVLDVQADDALAVGEAIDAVVASFAQHDRHADASDEIIVQRQVRELAMCGVLLTRDLSTNGPYFVAHVDRMTERATASDRVTAGRTCGTGVHYVLRGGPGGADGEIGRAVELARELEKLTCRDALDIEFGITHGGELNLLQVRPLAQPVRAQRLDDDLELECAQIYGHTRGAMGEHALLAGSTTVLSTMADWNPAEMIGSAPQPLALSLYQRLVGGAAWSQSRAALGYRHVWPAPLIHSLGGRPYVDVRASLNSLLPAEIDDAVAARLVDDGIGRLKRDPSGHDKVEFEIAHSCAGLDADGEAVRLKRAGLREEEVAHVQQALASLTDRMIVAGCAGPMAQLDSLECTLARLRTGRRESLHGLASQLQLTLAACEAHGTLPFAVLARQGFVALTMLRSLRRLDVLSHDEHAALLTSIPTVASELDRDLSRWAAGEIERDAMVDRYGHLRPNSYDVTSPSYGAAWGRYFGEAMQWRGGRTFPDVAEARDMLASKRIAIERQMRASGLDAPFEALSAFVIESVQSRERGKFIFMKAVHDVLELSAAIGALLGFGRDDVAMMPIGAIEALATGSPSGAVRMEWGRLVEFNRKRWALTSALRLPGVIREAKDVFAFEVEGARPTFVTQARVSGQVVRGDADDVGSDETFRGAIVLLKAADPGYDWLFCKGIAGLITAWGGAGSHMAIRAAEFGLPAAIGCGELMFDQLSAARRVELDGGVQTIRVLS